MCRTKVGRNYSKPGVVSKYSSNRQKKRSISKAVIEVAAIILIIMGRLHIGRFSPTKESRCFHNSRKSLKPPAFEMPNLICCFLFSTVCIAQLTTVSPLFSVARQRFGVFFLALFSLFSALHIVPTKLSLFLGGGAGSGSRASYRSQLRI